MGSSDSEEIFDACLQGHTLAAGSVGGACIFWDLRAPREPVNALCDLQTGDILSVSLNDSLFLAGSEDDSIAVYDRSRTAEDALELLLNVEHSVRAAAMVGGQVCFETLDNIVGAYNLATGGKNFAHFFQNTDDRLVYLVNSDIGCDGASLRAFSVDGARLREWAVGPDGYAAVRTYPRDGQDEVRHCLALDGDILAACLPGRVALAAPEPWDMESELRDYYS